MSASLDPPIRKIKPSHIRGLESHNDLVNALLKDQKVWSSLRRKLMRVVYRDIREGAEAPG